jgi:4,5-dihydroxyphthalate decarboxylase
MNSGNRRRLRMAITPLAHHAAILDGRVTVPGIEFVHAELGPDHAEIFRRMGRNLEFDVCELSVITYYCARQFGLPISAIPVVPRHAFRHSDFLVNVNAGIRSPKDLEGRRVGTRTYTVTPGVLDRGILADEFGVDVDSVTWVVAEPEHVAACGEHHPPNVVAESSEDLFPRLAAGELDAGIAGSNLRRSSSPQVAPFFANAEELDRKQYERTGFAPVFTCIAFKDELLTEFPSLAEELFAAFSRAREFGLQPDPKVARIVSGDPVPIGLEANRPSFEELLDLGRRQHILSGEQRVDDLFPAL